MCDPEDRRLFDVINEAFDEWLGHPAGVRGGTWRIAERILELVQLDAERRERDRPGPRCATCGKVRDDHPDHLFVMPRPKGCVCGEPRWNIEAPAICHKFVPPATRLFEGCDVCNHDEGCHANPGSLKRDLLESGEPDIHASAALRRLEEKRGEGL
jgi:hypothetical protein